MTVTREDGAKKSPGLIERAISLVKGFNPATQTSDSYADDVLGTSRDSHNHRRETADAISTSDAVFLKQVRCQMRDAGRRVVLVPGVFGLTSVTGITQREALLQ